MDDAITTTVVKDALEQVLREIREYADQHDQVFPVTLMAYFKCEAALRLLEEE